MMKIKCLQHKLLYLFIILSAISPKLIAQNKSYTICNYINDCKSPSISLNGKWKLKLKSSKKWLPVEVPGEVVMQGYEIKHDEPFTYLKAFTVPADYKGKEIILRFDGVYSHASLYLNNKKIKEHSGGFTRWETNITKYIKFNKKNEIQIIVTDKRNSISYASGYAHHPIGGILRKVTLFALPKKHIENFYLNGKLDSKLNDGLLEINYNYSSNEKPNLKFDLEGKKKEKLKMELISRIEKNKQIKLVYKIKKIKKWDAEHPNLYTIKVNSYHQKKVVSSFSKQVGFRNIEIKGNKMFVNGQQVKLRGACRHDMHPTLGRSTNRYLDSLDVALFKESNMNFVRTSHYPPSEDFLSFCDQKGLYVECETAICFVDTYRQKNYAPGKSQNDSTFTHKYLGQLKEMVQSLRSHSSILFWSIGNESNYGINFQKSYDWIKKEDTTRPAIFSYPGTVDKDKKCYDILSLHYPSIDGNMNQFGIITKNFENKDYPSIFDEWAHVPCYAYETLQKDPNIRDFWGESLDKMWGNLFNSPGGLGGAIWGYCDETFMIPELKIGKPFWIDYAHTAKPLAYQGKCVGYGEWGIVDVWRRKKPEFWGTKKAYSPIKITETHITDFVAQAPIYIKVHNRFDHTNLKEITIKYTYLGKEYEIHSTSINPHKKGLIKIPANKWKDKSKIKINFIDQEKRVIDTYHISLDKNKEIKNNEENKFRKLNIIKTNDKIIFKGNNFEIPFDKNNGLITLAKHKNKVIIEKGPFLNFDVNFNQKTGAEVREKAKNYVAKASDWKMSSFNYKIENNIAKIHLEGRYAKIELSIDFIINSNGNIYILYHTRNEPNGALRESGLKFILPNTFTKVKWNRKGYWSCYPEKSLSPNIGEAQLYNKKVFKYGEKPQQPWISDTHNYYYFADNGSNNKKPLTNIAKAMKENIYSYILLGKNLRLKAKSRNAKIACRISKNSKNSLTLIVNNKWDYPEIAWGNYYKNIEASPCFGHIRISIK